MRIELERRQPCLILLFWRWLSPTMQLARIDHSSFSWKRLFCSPLSLISSYRVRCGKRKRAKSLK
jgi:hypothetical protein